MFREHPHGFQIAISRFRSDKICYIILPKGLKEDGVTWMSTVEDATNAGIQNVFCPDTAQHHSMAILLFNARIAIVRKQCPLIINALTSYKVAIPPKKAGWPY